MQENNTDENQEDCE